ncbi:MAG: EAL domain-containing protein [Telmatospirillum sp.]|nr:EAL domain-containing protein [Telmatospirillum sp.]
MLRIDIGTLAFSAAVASLTSALIIASHGPSDGSRGRSWLFAAAAGCAGRGQIIALMGAVDRQPGATVVGNLLMLHSAIGLHLGCCRLSGRQPPVPLYVAAILLLISCYISFFQFDYSLNERISFIAALRVPIYLDAAFAIRRTRRGHPSRGLAILEIIAWCCGAMLLARTVAALYYTQQDAYLTTSVFWQASYYLLWAGADIALAISVLSLDGEAVAETLSRTVVARTSELRGREAELRLIFDTTHAAIFFVNLDGVITQANRSMADMFGRSPDALAGIDYPELVHVSERAVSRDHMLSLIHGRTPVISTERRYVRADGSEFWGHLSGRQLTGGEGEPLGLVGVIVDITERRRTAAHIEFLAHHDLLTGLPNRLLVEDRLLQSVARATRSRTKTALLFVDLDHFKAVNDSLGHSAGDSVLREVAGRLLTSVRDTDSVSRHGGDEFLVVLSEVRDSQAIIAVAEKILESLSRPVMVEGHEIFISASIGIAVSPDDGMGFEELLKKADTAMYHAKESGRNAHRFFSEQMNIETVVQFGLRSALRHALDRHEFELHYQPQIDLGTGGLVGVEALVRWRRPGHGLVGPSTFIPVAENTGLIVPMGAWVLREACLQAKSWQVAGLPQISMTVNLSAMQFRRGNLEETVLDALDAAGLTPDRLELELTETMLIENAQAVMSTVEKLRARGVRFTIDDFGTGYANLAYLKRFHVDKLKIDQSFVRNLHMDTEDAAIVRAIIQLARSFGLETVAEGVEDIRQLRFLRHENCKQAQGFLFARPLPADELVRFIRDSIPVEVS